jgi:hypothetical protein
VMFFPLQARSRGDGAMIRLGTPSLFV